jgi:ABC-type sugar transport system ATPase subunit
MGAGRTELMETIMGVRKPDSGVILLNGKPIRNRIPSDSIKHGIVMVPEDRKRSGLILKLSVRDNLLLSSIGKCVKCGCIRKSLEKKYVVQYSQKLEIKMRNASTMCANLSGGNQQKVAIAKALNADPDIIILDEPTRGIDVKTKADIHALMSQLACAGKSVLMVSSELPEVMGMSDRIAVLHEGTLTKILDRSETTSERIMALAVGSTVEG